jgi:hypothetical protein
MVSFTSRQLYPPVNKSLLVPLNRRLGGSWSRSGRYGEVAGLESRLLGRPARSQLLYRVRFRSSEENIASTFRVDEEAK